jgi:hypothetical protein
VPHFSWDLNGPEKIKKREVKATKGYPQTNVHYKKVISLSRQPPVLANQPRELIVSGNLGQLRNQQG